MFVVLLWLLSMGEAARLVGLTSNLDFKRELKYVDHPVRPAVPAPTSAPLQNWVAQVDMTTGNVTHLLEWNRWMCTAGDYDGWGKYVAFCTDTKGDGLYSFNATTGEFLDFVDLQLGDNSPLNMKFDRVRRVLYAVLVEEVTVGLYQFDLSSGTHTLVSYFPTDGIYDGPCAFDPTAQIYVGFSSDKTDKDCLIVVDTSKKHNVSMVVMGDGDRQVFNCDSPVFDTVRKNAVFCHNSTVDGWVSIPFSSGIAQLVGPGRIFGIPSLGVADADTKRGEMYTVVYNSLGKGQVLGVIVNMTVGTSSNVTMKDDFAYAAFLN